MLRLLIDGKDVELYAHEPVNMVYQFTEIQEIQSPRSSYSQTFRVPLTRNNEDILGPINDPNAVLSWAINRKRTASILDDAIELARGYIQVKRIVNQKGRYTDVEIAFFGEVADLSKAVGDALLSDLDLSAYAHQITGANAISSWAGTLFSGKIRYGIVDRYQNWSGSSTWATLGTNLTAQQLTPFFRVSAVVDAIMSEAGFTYESTFLSGKTDLYLMGAQGGEFLATTASSALTGVHVGLAADFVASGTTTQTLSLAETGVYYDSGGNHAAGVYTAPLDGVYQWYYRVKLDAVSGAGTLNVYLYYNSTPVATILSGALGSLSTTITYASNVLLGMNTGDTVSIRYVFGTAGNTATFGGYDSLIPPTTSLELLYCNPAGSTVNVAANLPKMKQIEFLLGLQRTFNLTFVADRNRPNHLYIEPLGDYYASGDTKDWTGRMDLSKDVEITTTADLQRRAYEWTHLHGDDFISKAISAAYNRAYGRFQVTDPANDFATGDMQVQSGFAPFIPSLIPGTSFIVMRLLSEDLQPIQEPLPRLAYWNGLAASGEFYFAGATRTSYPLFTNFSVAPASITPSSEDLNYGPEEPFFAIAGNPNNTLYYKYWYPFVGQLYSPEARILTAYFRLLPSEISQFEWSDRIFLKDAYYRILKIEFGANDQGALTRVQLLKIIPSPRYCRWIPSSFNKDKKISFGDSDGTTDTQVSEFCCELFGHRFNPGTSECYTTQVQ